MLQNAYFLAKIGADTAENEQHFAEILPIGRRVADHGGLHERDGPALRLSGAGDAPGQRPTLVGSGERGRRGTEPFELLRSEFGQNSWNQ